VKSDSDKIEFMVSEKRVKLHVFEPSMTKIWTVVGKGEEHWIDPDSIYCSCPGFYFGKLNGKDYCYHLDSAKIAIETNQFEKITFSDDEFENFISALISDLKGNFRIH
jgi:predicted nucleic acid-binding Zn finger protein